MKIEKVKIRLIVNLFIKSNVFFKSESRTIYGKSLRWEKKRCSGVISGYTRWEGGSKIFTSPFTQIIKVYSSRGFCYLPSCVKYFPENVYMSIILSKKVINFLLYFAD